MLVLTRKIGEKILIGQDIVVTITAIDAHRVRVGIDAPAQVPVLRAELDPSGLRKQNMLEKAIP